MNPLTKFFTRNETKQDTKLSQTIKTLKDELASTKDYEKFLDDYARYFKKKNPDSKPELLPGVFTTSKRGYRIRFTRGNLCALVNEGGNKVVLWTLHKNQYDTVGNTKAQKECKGGLIDLFGWTEEGMYNDGVKQFGINNSISPSDFYNINDNRPCIWGQEKKPCDWGGCLGKEYKLLSDNEWRYLLKNRSSIGFINGIKCLFLKPDGFNGTVKEKYSVKEWEMAEKAGLVALPITKNRSGDKIYSRMTCAYWTKNNNLGEYGCAANIGDHSYISNKFWKSAGCCIRLVERTW